MTTTMLFPVLFMIVGALIYAFSDKAKSLGLALFLAGAIALCFLFARLPIHF